jgi:glycosyltransferase involved in cell wall biosynthesis
LTLARVELNPLVSVVVAVRDDRPGLERLLTALEEQTLPADRFEVVVADDGSTDGATRRLPASYHLRVTRGPPRNAYAARNRAARLARSAALAFCDADCTPEPTWLEAGLAALETAELVAGPIRMRAPRDPTVWSLLSIDLFLDQEREVRRGRALTANLFVRRVTFEAADGFDESLPSGGDFDFVQRCVAQDARLRFEPAAVVEHPTIDDAPGLVRKVWFTNRSSGARGGRAAMRPPELRPTGFVPVLGVAVARRRAFRPALGLDERRLAAAGAAPPKRARAVAVFALHAIVAPTAVAAQLAGWRAGRRLRRG